MVSPTPDEAKKGKAGMKSECCVYEIFSKIIARYAQILGVLGGQRSSVVYHFVRNGEKIIAC